jgi:hypothetical protein
MKTRKFASLLLLAVLLISINPMQVSAGSDTTQVVSAGSDTTWVFMNYDLGAKTGLSSMEMDSNDRINVLYAVLVDGKNEFRFARQTDAGWEIETVATGQATSSFDLALDTNDNPHFVFRNRAANTNNLGYYHKSGGNWLYEALLPVNSYPEDPIIQFDQNGHPHIATTGSGRIYYLFWDGFTWIRHDIQQYANYAWLALDSTGNPGIAFVKDMHEIHYAEWNVDQWVIQKIDTTVDNLYELSLAVDSNDQPHIAYWVMTQTGNLKYAHRSGETEWTITPVGALGRVPSIAIDSAGNPHIASFHNIDPKYIEYSSWTGSSWQIEQVTAYPEIIAGAMRLTKTDQPRIIISQWDTQMNSFMPQKILFKGTQAFLPLVIR